MILTNIIQKWLELWDKPKINWTEKDSMLYDLGWGVIAIILAIITAIFGTLYILLPSIKKRRKRKNNEQ